jgi:hypothetical protein
MEQEVKDVTEATDRASMIADRPILYFLYFLCLLFFLYLRHSLTALVSIMFAGNDLPRRSYG